jgi:hypothetical protein
LIKEGDHEVVEDLEYLENRGITRGIILLKI